MEGQSVQRRRYFVTQTVARRAVVDENQQLPVVLRLLKNSLHGLMAQRPRIQLAATVNSSMPENGASRISSRSVLFIRIPLSRNIASVRVFN